MALLTQDQTWAVQTMERNLQDGGMLTFVPQGKSYRVLVASHGKNAALGGITDITDGAKAVGAFAKFDGKPATPQRIAIRLGIWRNGNPDLYTYTTLGMGKPIRIAED